MRKIRRWKCKTRCLTYLFMKRTEPPIGNSNERRCQSLEECCIVRWWIWISKIIVKAWCHYLELQRFYSSKNVEDLLLGNKRCLKQSRSANQLLNARFAFRNLNEVNESSNSHANIYSIKNVFYHGSKIISNVQTVD